MELNLPNSVHSPLPLLQPFKPPNFRQKKPKRSNTAPTMASPASSSSVSDAESILRNYSRMLQRCASRRSLLAGKSVHARLLRTGVEPDAHLWDSLVNLYSKCASIEHARILFDEMPHRDVVAWTSLLAGYGAEGKGREGVGLFCRMLREGIWPNEFALAAGLKACAVCLDLSFGRQLHGRAIKLRFLWDLFVGASLIDLYAKCWEVELAEKVFFGLPWHNVVCWNALLNGYAVAGNAEKVLSLYSKMAEFQTRLSKHSLSIALKCCAQLGDARHGRALHSLAIKIRLDVDEFLGSVLVDMYSKCGLADDAYRIFIRIEHSDVVVWSEMISCFDQQGFSIEAVELFKDMQRIEVKPNEFVLASIASVASELADKRFGASVHAFIIKAGFEMGNVIGNVLVSMYMRSGAVRDSCKVFDDLENCDTMSWNAVLSGFHSGTGCEEGLRVFRQMLIESFMPNEYTFISILRSCASKNAGSYGAQVHAHIVKNNLENNAFVSKALVDMYTSCGNLEHACLVFDRMEERDVFSWTVIITGLAKTDQEEEAIKIYKKMQREGAEPNEFTLASCLRACSSLAALDTGRQLHSWTTKSGHSSTYVSSSLVDMYIKCGCIADAEVIFDGLTSRDKVSWNTMICGYSQHGYGEKALNAFLGMLDEGLKPDEVTFIGVLSACSRTGLLDEGRKHFDSLNSVYGITPTTEHYACLVDILARAGRLEEVESFINEMRIVPDALILQTLLSACRMHGNVEFGEKAAEKLLNLEPLMDSSYILLANLYASSKRWDDVARVRRRMFSKGVKKEPGCSWIEVNGQVRVFLSQRNSHPTDEERPFGDERIDLGKVSSRVFSRFCIA